MNEIQSIILDIYVHIKSICDENDLRYYAIGGTCLGAIRHKGFIPWDDDLDIAMPEKDYKRFIHIANNNLPPYLRLITPKNYVHSICLFSKVHNVKTTLIESVDYPEDYKGVYVDIMPLYGVPSNRIESKRYINKLRLLQRLNYAKRRSFRECRGLLRKLFWLIMRPFNMFVDDIYYISQWEKVVEKNSFDMSQYTGYLWAKRLKQLIFPKEWFGDYVEKPFETTTIRCPAGWDSFLKCMFGDYMQLPPEEERSTHGEGGIVDLHRSYLFYQKNNRYTFNRKQ